MFGNPRELRKASLTMIARSAATNSSLDAERSVLTQSCKPSPGENAAPPCSIHDRFSGHSRHNCRETSQRERDETSTTETAGVRSAATATPFDAGVGGAG